jgi:hypothetical protein
MQTSTPPGQPQPVRTKLDDATDLNTAFTHFGEEPVIEAPVAPAPEPVAQVTPFPVSVDEPVVIPEPARQQIQQIAEANYQREFLDSLRREHEHLVRGIFQREDMVKPLLTTYGPDGPQWDDFSEQYVAEQIDAMDDSDIQKYKWRGYAKDYFAAKERKRQADQEGWKENQKREMEAAELGTRKTVQLLNRAIKEPEFAQLNQLRSRAAVGDPWSIAELAKCDAFWQPRALAYEQAGYDKGKAIRESWRDLMREQPIKLAPAPEPHKEEGKKTSSATPKPKTTYATMEERARLRPSGFLKCLKRTSTS